MTTNITARHFELTEQMREFINKKLSKLERYSSYISRAELTLTRDSGQDSVEGRLHLRRDLLTARGNSQDLMEAVSDVIDRLLTQLKRHDERLRDRKKTAAKKLKP